MQQSRSYLFLFLVFGLTALSAVLFTFKDYRFGLDVQGGVRFVYEMDFSKLTAEQKESIGTVVDNVLRTMTNRASASLGVQEGLVQRQGTNRIVVELPGFTDAKEAAETIGTTASLEWYWARNVATELVPRQYTADQGHIEYDGKPAVTFRSRSNPDKQITPADPEYRKIVEGWTLLLRGDDLASASAQLEGDHYIPTFRFSREGARKMREWTTRHTQRGEYLAAVLDGQVISIAPLQRGAIISDRGQITGQFEKDYVFRLVRLLNAGSIPVTLTQVAQQVVDPTIGKHALNQMVLAGLVAFGFTALFLLFYYQFPGLVALVALILYTLFTLTALKLIGATFSLAAIAGFILSIGMAVDANILVFERFKEEMREGRQLMSAMELGFRRALPAIVDSNACTILTSLVLVNLGTGPVKGFASTLIIGVAISLFTAITVTRSLLVFLVGSGLGNDPKWYGLNRQWFGEGLEKSADQKPLQIVNNSKRWFVISMITILIGIPFMLMGGLKPNVEFLGGYEAGYLLPEGSSPTGAQIIANLEKNGFEGANLKYSATSEGRIAYVTVPRKEGLDEAQAQEAVRQAAGVPVEQSREFASVGPSVQRETWRNAILGVILSSALIVLYLSFRFGIALGGFIAGLRFALSAIGALVHDVLVVLGIAALAGYLIGWEISALFITSMLTVIGFSVHDTIVIFDRIRENLRKPLRGEEFGNLVNRSITQSIARSINTGITVVATLIILMALGTPTPDLKFFSLAMLVGILSGTYSSLYNAAPILYLWDRAVRRRRGEEHGFMGMAAAEARRVQQLAVQQAAAAPTTPPATQSYGQVRRRSSAGQKKRPGSIDLDEEER
ncbi:MAG TPA: protein translocase subunit SecD [Fimbriimonadaceae bacterium]|nr:protein translocase subunit SecD [Fimbriimonadaceae bacterium]